MRVAVPSAVLLLCLLSALPTTAQRSARLEQARELVDRGDVEAALPLLDALLAREPKNAEAYLLRSTARFLWGDVEAGSEDLDKALELDPGLRQGWLNRAGLRVSEGRLDEALAAFEKARQLDPSAPDNAINIGAVRLLQGNLSGAAASFQEYLAGQRDNPEAFYLVATNYALVGYSALAGQHLQRAVALDERIRVRVRGDANFRDMWLREDFERLMNTDRFEAAPGSHQSSLEVDLTYASGQGLLLEVVLDALHALSLPFDSAVEVAPEWALVWSEVRIKVRDLGGDHGVVELYAPADRFTPAGFRERSDTLLREVAKQAQKRRFRRQHGPVKPSGSPTGGVDPRV